MSIKLSAKALEILKVLQKEGKGTVAFLKTKIDGVNPSHLTALARNELVVSSPVTIKCECCGHSRKVLEHTITELGMAYEVE